MDANWNLFLNAALLIGVIAALVYTLKKKQEPILPMHNRKPTLGVESLLTSSDDIIAVRKVEPESAVEVEIEPETTFAEPSPSAQPVPLSTSPEKVLMIFLLAKPNRQLAGYEMLQTILSAGLRFGEGQLFHRHQFTNGQGPILCSLAAATASGTFDLHNIGAFNARGLCLFMQCSDNPAVDLERLNQMVDTAQQLAEGLDTYILDDDRKPFTEATRLRYSQQIDPTYTACEPA